MDGKQVLHSDRGMSELRYKQCLFLMQMCKQTHLLTKMIDKWVVRRKGEGGELSD